MNFIRLLIFIIYLSVIGCSTSSRKVDYPLHQILLYNLHLRKVYEEGHQSGSNLDCESLKDFYRNIDFRSLRGCLLNSSELQNSRVADYDLKREKAPFLEIIEDKNLSPSCLKQFLSQIPVPREIIFQTQEEGRLNCYHAQIKVFEDSLLGIPAFFSRVHLHIDLETSQIPRTDEDWVFLLGTWSITPFFEEKAGERVLFSNRLPSDICSQCIGEKNLFHEKDILPQLWP